MSLKKPNKRQSSYKEKVERGLCPSLYSTAYKEWRSAVGTARQHALGREHSAKNGLSDGRRRYDAE